MLLLAPIGNNNTQWVPGRSIGADLLLQHLPDPGTRRVEWRRDCLIVVDEHGDPRYLSLPAKEFHAAFGDPATIQSNIEKLIQDTLQTAREHGTGSGVTPDPLYAR